MITRFKNGRILRNHRFVDEELWVVNGKISSKQPRVDEEIDLQGRILAPGYIDLQINGAFGIDFSENMAGLTEVSKRLPRYGVTSFLPTIATTTSSKYHQLLPQFKSTAGAVPLGIHLEGPFLNPLHAGAHQKDLFLSFEGEDPLASCYGDLRDVKLITLAPELPGAFAHFPQLTTHGIIVSAGHTHATFEEMQWAADAGVALVTHLFNSMSPFHHRNPGVVGAALTHPGLKYTIIADGFHVHPAAIKLAWEANPKGLILISDAVSALGLAEGTYTLSGQSIQVKDNKATLEDQQTLAGSLLSLDAAVRNLRQWTGCSLIEAIEAASFKPAELLKLPNKGRLNEEADADLIILDHDLRVLAAYVNGVNYFTTDSRIGGMFM